MKKKQKSDSSSKKSIVLIVNLIVLNEKEKIYPFVHPRFGAYVAQTHERRCRCGPQTTPILSLESKVDSLEPHR